MKMDFLEFDSQEAYATAAILLKRVQNRLPQWASVRDDQVTLGRNIRDRAAERTVELTPQFLLIINWADSGHGFSCPETYNVTYVPMYDVFVVTGSVDSTDIYGVTDFAVGHFRRIIESEWYQELFPHVRIAPVEGIESEALWVANLTPQQQIFQLSVLTMC